MKKIKIKSLSIIFPLYNEEIRLKKSLAKIKKIFFKLQIREIEIILVNDGSLDNSHLIIKNFIQNLNQKEKNLIRYIRYSKNMGKGYACKRGVQVARKSWILICDIDFSADPLEILDWSKKNFLTSNKECYFGSRNLINSKIKYKIYRRILGKIFSKFRKLLFNINIVDTQCGFKLYPKKIAKKVFSKINQNGYIFDVEVCMVLKKLDIKVKELPIKWEHIGNSKLNIFTDGIIMVFDLIKLRLSKI